MRNSFLVKTIACVLAASSCACTENTTSYRGVFVSLFETSNFEPCDSNEHWWLTPDGPINHEFYNRMLELTSDYEHQIGESIGNGSPLYFLNASGPISELGKFGHLGLYDREFNVESFFEFRLATREETTRCMTSGFLPGPDLNESKTD